jgi:hypothetical protein
MQGLKELQQLCPLGGAACRAAGFHHIVHGEAVRPRIVENRQALLREILSPRGDAEIGNGLHAHRMKRVYRLFLDRCTL